MSLSNRQIIRLMDKKKVTRDELFAIIEEKLVEALGYSISKMFI